MACGEATGVHEASEEGAVAEAETLLKGEPARSKSECICHPLIIEAHKHSMQVRATRRGTLINFLSQSESA